MLLNKKNKQSGQTIILTVLLTIMISVLVIGGIAVPTSKAFQDMNRFENSKQSYFTAESGVEDVAYRLRSGFSVPSSEEIELGGATATIEIESGVDSQVVSVVSDKNSAIRKIGASFTIGSGASFNFGVQTDQGGFIMRNNSVINGSLFSNGTVTGYNSSTVTGDVVSAGESGLVDGITAGGSAYANTITDADIGGDAYYQNISGSSVAGDLYPDSPDIPQSSLPITDETIEEWKTAAEAGGVITSPCPYTISSNTILGPVKIACDLNISGNNYTLQLNGPVWVEGDISFNNNPNVAIDPSLGRQSIAMIADNEANRSTGSKINMGQGATFYGSGEEGSYVLLLSKNNSAEQGGTEDAITLNQAVSGDIFLYAGNGKIMINNSGDLRQLTAYMVEIEQSASVTYETGMASLIFSSGPGGTWNILSWGETE